MSSFPREQVRSATRKSGFSVILFLAMTCVVSFALTIVFSSTYRFANAISTAFSRETLRLEARNEIAEFLMSLEKDEPALATMDSVAIDLDFLSRGPHPMVYAKTSKTSLKATVARRVLFGLYRNQNSLPPKADWQALERMNPPKPLCSSWKREGSPLRKREGKRGHLVSNITCVALSGPPSSNAIIRGNLELHSPLIFENLRNTNLTLAIRGFLQIDDSLVFDNTQRLTLEIISAGDVHMRSLSVIDTSEGRLLVHSSSGSIFVDDEMAFSKHLDCPIGSLEVRLEAMGGVFLSEERARPQISLGCFHSRFPSVWPRIKLLGESWN